MQNKQRFQNRLDYYRRRMKFLTSRVGQFLGHKDSSTYRDYERGERLPSLINAFRLSIILRTPVEFLFGELYDHLKREIRAEEERLAQPKQRPLF